MTRQKYKMLFQHDAKDSYSEQLGFYHFCKPLVFDQTVSSLRGRIIEFITQYYIEYIPYFKMLYNWVIYRYNHATMTQWITSKPQ